MTFFFVVGILAFFFRILLMDKKTPQKLYQRWHHGFYRFAIWFCYSNSDFRMIKNPKNCSRKQMLKLNKFTSMIQLMNNTMSHHKITAYFTWISHISTIYCCNNFKLISCIFIKALESISMSLIITLSIFFSQVLWGHLVATVHNNSQCSLAIRLSTLYRVHAIYQQLLTRSWSMFCICLMICFGNTQNMNNTSLKKKRGRSAIRCKCCSLNRIGLSTLHALQTVRTTACHWERKKK